MIRLRAQQLINPDFTDVKDVVAWMGAIQAQQPRMAKLALGIRTRGATMQQIKQALDRGEILRTHVLRPTWHYVSPNDIRWMLQFVVQQTEICLRIVDERTRTDHHRADVRYR